MRADRVWVFDLDDTLYSEYEYMVSGYKQVAKHVEQLYHVTLPCQKLVEWWEADRATVFQKTVDYIDGPQELIESIVWVYRTHMPVIELYDDAKKLIDSIQGIEPYFIITDGRSLTQRQKISALDLKPEYAYISEEVGVMKPDTPAFDTIQNNFPNAEILYFADNPKKDFLKPNQLDWKTFGMLDKGKNIHKQDVQIEKDYLPLRWLRSFDDL